jgi:hypothetical protein
MTPDQQTATILDAMGMAGPEYDGPSRMRAVAAMVEELDRRLKRAVAEGRQPLARMAEFRRGEWPPKRQLVALVQEIKAKADAMARGAA